MRKRWRLPPILGPLFGYDLVASARRGQHTGLRILIGIALLFTLYVVYSFQVRGFDPFTDPFAPTAQIDPKDMADFARVFAEWCMIVQFAAVILITPIVVADAVAREKERRALDFLFVTALTDREIILGKLGSRLASMTSVVLTGMPIVMLTELFGGVDPNLLWCGYASLFATLLSLGSLSLYCSVVSNTALQATVRSYAAAAGFLMVCPCLIVPLVNSDAAVPGMIVYVMANVVVTSVLINVSIHDLRPRAEVLPPAPVTADKLAPQPNNRKSRPLVIAVATVVHAELDDEALPFVLDAEAPLPANRGWDPADWRSLDRPTIWEPPELPRVPLPPIDDQQPLLWKEVHLHSFTAAATGGQPVVGMVLVLAAILAVLLWLVIAIEPGSRAEVAAFSTGLVKVGTVILGGLLGLGAIVHAVNAVTREREKDTLDGLLTLPVTRDEVLSAKWLGGLVSLRMMAVALAGVWLFGLATGGLHRVALVALALAVAAVIEFLASLGLFLSVVSKTSLRANMAAVLSLLLVAVGPLVISQYIELLAPHSVVNRVSGAGWLWLVPFGDPGRTNQPVATISDTLWNTLMPAITWVRLCVGWHEYAKLSEGYFPTLLTGALGYATAAWLLWRATLSRFRRYGGKRQ